MRRRSSDAKPFGEPGWRHLLKPPSVELPLDYLLSLDAATLRTSDVRESGLTHFPGLARSRRRGQGLEFEDLRQYQAGDDIRHVDWNVTARLGEPYLRLYREERERATTVALDLQPSMFTGRDRLRAVRAGEIAAALLWQAAASGDRVGVTILSPAAIAATRPATGERGILPALRAIAAEFAATSARRDEGEAALVHLVDWVNSAGRAAGDVLLVSAMDGDRDALRAALGEAGDRRILSALQVGDEFDAAQVAPGNYLVSEGGVVAAIRLDRDAARKVAERLAAERTAIAALFAEANVPLAFVPHDLPLGDVLASAIRSGFLSGG